MKAMLQNWRAWIIGSLMILTLMLFGAEAEDTGVFLITKVLGIVVGGISYLLIRSWESYLTAEEEDEEE